MVAAALFAGALLSAAASEATQAVNAAPMTSAITIAKKHAKKRGAKPVQGMDKFKGNGNTPPLLIMLLSA